MRRFPHLLIFALAPILGCPTDPTDTSKTGDSDADTDTDSDTDADSDADSDTEVTHTDPNATQALDDAGVAFEYHIHGQADLTETTMTGGLTYQSMIDGATVCDFETSMTGTAYTGDCEGCDFAYLTETTVIRDDGTDACVPSPVYSYLENDTYHDLIFAHADEWVVQGYYGNYTYYDAVLTGYGYYFAYYGVDYPGPYWSMTGHADNEYTTFTRDGDHVEWGFDQVGTYVDWYNYLAYCDYVYTYYGYYPVVGGDGGTSTIDCAGGHTDVWTFDAVEGGSASISVDTVAADSAFDPAFYVVDPDGCLVASADDMFDCTFPPLAYYCPAAEMVETAAGTYSVVVRSFGSCTGDVGEYDFQVDVRAP